MRGRVIFGLTSDMITITQENIAMKSELNSEIKSLHKDLYQHRRRKSGGWGGVSKLCEY